MRGRVPHAKVDPTLNIATDGRYLALLDGDSVVCLDAETGKQLGVRAFRLMMPITTRAASKPETKSGWER